MSTIRSLSVKIKTLSYVHKTTTKRKTHKSISFVAHDDFSTLSTLLSISSTGVAFIFEGRWMGNMQRWVWSLYQHTTVPMPEITDIQISWTVSRNSAMLSSKCLALFWWVLDERRRMSPHKHSLSDASDSEPLFCWILLLYFWKAYWPYGCDASEKGTVNSVVGKVNRLSGCWHYTKRWDIIMYGMRADQKLIEVCLFESQCNILRIYIMASRLHIHIWNEFHLLIVHMLTDKLSFREHLPQQI